MTQNTDDRREALAELAQNDAARSYTAQIRELYDVIEKALNAGVSRTLVHQKLVDTGLAISLRNFDQAMYRIRKSRKKTNSIIPNNSYDHPEAISVNSTPANETSPSPKLTFRQMMKQNRQEIENTDWAKLIRERELEKSKHP